MSGSPLPLGPRRLALAWRRGRDLLLDPRSLAGRSAVASAWRFGGEGAIQAIRLGGNLVMTRLLFPEAFGLMAIVLTLQLGLVMMTDIGLRPAVVRSPHGEDPAFLRTAWTMKTIQFALMAALLALLGGGLAVADRLLDFSGTIYGDPRLPWLIAAMALPFLLRGLESINVALAERRIVVGRHVMIQLAGQTAGAATMVGFALVEPTVWALFFGSVANAALTSALSHLVLPGPRMGWLWRRAHVAEIWSFGKWIVGASVFGYLARQADKLILGALLEPTAFGMYAIARIWLDAVGLAVNKIMRPLIFSGLSETSRRRPERLRAIFARFRAAQGLMCLGLFLLLFLGGPLMVRLLYTPEYAPVGAILAMLSPFILLQSYEPFMALVLSKGESRSAAGVIFVRCAALVLSLPLAFQFGAHWAFLAVALNEAWGTPRLLRLSARHLPLSLTRERLGLALMLGVAAAAWAAASPAGAGGR